jgi:hypothetical protein
VQAGYAVGGQVDDVAAGLEIVRQVGREIAVVLDDQHAHAVKYRRGAQPSRFLDTGRTGASRRGR